MNQRTSASPIASTWLLSLVGEQPIPILLAARALNAQRSLLCCTKTTRRVAENLAALLHGAVVHEIEPYDLPLASRQIEALCDPRTTVNLTGGTKPMALAAYEAARKGGLPLTYLQSEGRQVVLYYYNFQGVDLIEEDRRALGPLIDIKDYLLAHGLHPQAEKGPQNAQEAGLRRWLEGQVDECRTNLIFDAFEIDFILRRGNRAAVLEAKMTARNSRFGIDQLNTIAGRAYLGTYTGKVLVVSKPLGPQLSRLAEARQVQVVVLQGRQDGRTGRLVLDAASRERLRLALDAALSPSTKPSLHDPS